MSDSQSHSAEKSRAYFEKADPIYAASSHFKWLDLAVATAHGATVTDIDGNEYIDLHGNGSVGNIGHSHPRVVEAIKDQADRLVNYSAAFFYHDRMVETIEKLAATTPGDFPKKVAFGTSGSDANDGMMKYARAYTKRTTVLTFSGAYHGTSYGALTMSTCTSTMRTGSGPLVPEVHTIPFPDFYHKALPGETEEEFTDRYLGYVEEMLATTIPAEEVAAVIIEPIQGDAGIVKPPVRYVQQLAELCKRNGILLGVDEINQGLGRTGTMWSIEHFDVVPDLLTTAKSLANGLPLSAVVGRAEVIDSLQAPGHIFTNAGNPIACAACSTVLDVIAEEGLVERSRELGEWAKARLNELQEKHPAIGDVRMYGLNGAIELVKDRDTKEPDSDATNKVMKYCHEHGVILITLAASVLRFQPPLNTPKEQLEQGIAVLDDAFTALENGEIELDTDEALGWT